MQSYYDETGRTLKFGIVNTAEIGGFACVGKGMLFTTTGFQSGARG